MPEQKQTNNPLLNNFKVTITAKARHGILWEARKLFKNQKEMAEYLGLSQQLVGQMLNLNWFCNLKQERFSTNPKWLSVFQKLMDLTGRNIYEIFPEELAGQKINNKIEVTREVPIQDLLESGEEPAYFPEDEYDRKELAGQIDKILLTLTPREEKVIRKRFGLGDTPEHTLEEVAQDFEVSKERLRQIEKKALNKLRHPSRSNRLMAFADGHKRLKPISIPHKDPHFTFPVFAKNHNLPASPLVPAGITVWPDINASSVPKGFNSAHLMLPFSRNMGAYLPIPFSDTKHCESLPSFLTKGQNLAIKKGLITPPGLSDEECNQFAIWLLAPRISTGLLKTPGKGPSAGVTLYDLLSADDAMDWNPSTGFIVERLMVTVYHQIEALEYHTPHFRFVCLNTLFGGNPEDRPRISFQAHWNLPKRVLQQRKSDKENAFKRAKEELLPWIQKHILAGVGFEYDPLNNTEWFFTADAPSDIISSIQRLESSFSEIESNFLEFIDAYTKQRKQAHEAWRRKNQERWRIDLEQKQLREELRKKEREAFEKPLTTETLQNLDPLKALSLAFDYEYRIKDLPKAISLYQMSAEKGCSEGQFQLSQKYLYGIGVQANLNEAVRLLHLAVAQGLSEAGFTLARLYEIGKGVEENQAMAHSLYQQAADNDHPGAFLRLGERYESGFGIQQNLEQAESCYRDAVVYGSPGAIFNLERLLYRKNNPSLSETRSEFI